MAVALVSGQSVSGTGALWSPDGIATITLPTAATVGNTIVVAWGISADLTFSVDDGGGNTYITPRTNLNGSNEVFITAAPVTTGTDTINVNRTGGSTPTQGSIWVGEFSGLDNADLFEAEVLADITGGTDNHDVGPITTTVAHSLLVGILEGTPGTYQADGDWTNGLAPWTGGTIAYKILTATTTTEDWTINTSGASEDSAMLLVALNGTAGGGGGGNDLSVGHIGEATVGGSIF